ncbi:hypothetical protein [Nocardia sp. CNY236]|uniref:hypothetical protein n=1 Tax=Nocardia sp. CNY236 TaxID=1169152 RepID=UPI0012DE98B3|nr:hypothetical protein [Nocardia sp. CNY236]
MNAVGARVITRRLLLCVTVVAALTASTASVATAAPLWTVSSPRDAGDTTGRHHIDPMGYHHRDRNPLLNNQHDSARRDYHRQRAQTAPTDTGPRDGSSSTTWSPVPRSDGSGYTVCRPQAAWCR